MRWPDRPVRCRPPTCKCWGCRLPPCSGSQLSRAEWTGAMAPRVCVQMPCSSKGKLRRRCAPLYCRRRHSLLQAVTPPTCFLVRNTCNRAAQASLLAHSPCLPGPSAANPCQRPCRALAARHGRARCVRRCRCTLPEPWRQECQAFMSTSRSPHAWLTAGPVEEAAAPRSTPTSQVELAVLAAGAAAAATPAPADDTPAPATSCKPDGAHSASSSSADGDGSTEPSGRGYSSSSVRLRVYPVCALLPGALCCRRRRRRARRLPAPRLGSLPSLLPVLRRRRTRRLTWRPSSPASSRCCLLARTPRSSW